ncbi:MAG: glycosidase [Bacillota bacterium]
MARIIEKETAQTLPLKRYPGNPILEPKRGHWWESRYVLNSGAIRINGVVHIFYRALGTDGVSRLGLARSPDGLCIEERLAHPVFEPIGEAEKMGCEDPRLFMMGDRVFLFYNAYDGRLAQIGLASIDVEDLLADRWDRWERHGHMFPGQPHRNPVLFPERTNGEYVLYYRIKPNIVISRAQDLTCPWNADDGRFFMGPRENYWDDSFIGGGAPPIKTEYGWLLIYHGVDQNLVYRLGAFLVALDDPSTVLYRTPDPVLEPREVCEVGEPGKCWVPNVVFTCGAVPREDKEVLGAHDEILVYYGAADSVIGVATASVSDLVPCVAGWHEDEEGAPG